MTSSVRSSPAQAGGRFRPCLCVGLRFSRALLGRVTCDSPRLFRAKAGSEPRRTHRRWLPCSASLPGAGASRITALGERRLRSGVARPPSVAPRMVETMKTCVPWADPPGVKVRRERPRGRAARASRAFPSSSMSRAPWVARGGHGTGRQESLPHDQTELDPRSDLPREEESRHGNQDAFHLPETRRAEPRVCVSRVARPQSTPRHAAPSRREVALQSRSTRLLDRGGCLL